MRTLKTGPVGLGRWLRVKSTAALAKDAGLTPRALTRGLTPGVHMIHIHASRQNVRSCEITKQKEPQQKPTKPEDQDLGHGICYFSVAAINTRSKKDL